MNAGMIAGLALATALCAAGGAPCQAIGQGVDFTPLSHPPDYAGSYANGYAQGRQMAADRAARQQAQAAAQQDAEARAAAARDYQNARKRASEAGRLIAAGRCDDARTLALNDGDFELASRVTSFCAAK